MNGKDDVPSMSKRFVNMQLTKFERIEKIERILWVIIIGGLVSIIPIVLLIMFGIVESSIFYIPFVIVGIGILIEGYIILEYYSPADY